jgi:porphobilinogen synthase
MTLGNFPNTRLRRLRYNPAIRELVQEIKLDVNDFILPLFIRHGKAVKQAISSMPGHYQLSIDHLEEEIKNILELGIKAVILFGIPEKKDETGSDAYSKNGIIQSAIREIKRVAPQMLIISDICCCEYTSHGHCGIIVKQNNEYLLDNDKTLEVLTRQVISHAQAGTDIIAPSGMIDGMVKTIRHALDNAGFQNTPILSYAVKYNSSLYGPFRQAAEGAPQFGDRSTHMMDFANKNEALRECALDVAEGADMLMIKPAHAYLDIIYKVKTSFPTLPLGAYHTSGEYAPIKAAAEKGWIDERKVALEILTAIRRAGADFIFTYFAKDAAKWLKEGS